MDKPTGTVTFLFTDIEGSTKLSQNFPETLPEALDKHHSILTEAVESNNGFVFKIIGDAFCCVFQNAEDAVKAAVDAQIKLNSEEWKDAVIKVRMGIHIGNAEWNGTDYMGYITLARSSRVMSAANGGQILISDKAYEKVKFNIAGQISFRDLGERRLKDLIQPVKLYQILSPGIPSEFPPLKTLDARANNLPRQLTNFIGREYEIPEIKKILAVSRLLTLSGPGGTGKTRLSLQIAADVIDEFANGVWIVELAPLFDPELILLKICEALGINEQPGDQTQKGDTESTLLNYLKGKELLLILDNCEHLIRACAEKAEMLLRNCPKLKIIATSREALRCEGEVLHKVLSLAHPEPKDINTPLELSQYEAVRLFIERALAVNTDFRVTNENAPALAQICYQLDGIPLAIELAAARIKILPLEKICEKLDDRFRLLTGGKRTALPRQQTLKAMIDWSYDLLNEKEKILFSRLSVFTGGWTLDAAEEICRDEITDIFEIMDLHSNLLDKSLINKTEVNGELRFNYLETMKQYSKEKLDPGDEVFKNHLNFFLKISDQKEMEVSGKDQKQWVKQIDSEADNFRAALQWAAENDQTAACIMINNLTDYWNLKGSFMEGLQICKKLLNSNLNVDEIHKANVLYNAGVMSNYLGILTEAEKLGSESLIIYRKIDYKEGISKCLLMLGVVFHVNPSRIDQTKKYYDEALLLAKEIDNKSILANAFFNMSYIAVTEGKNDLALEYRLQSLELYRKLKNFHQVSMTLSGLSVYECRRNDYDKALLYNEESLAISYELNDKYLISINLINLGHIYKGLKDYDSAFRYYNESLTLLREYSYKSSLIVALMSLGEILIIKGEYKEAVDFNKESIRIGKENANEYFLAANLYFLGSAYFELKDYETSLRYFLNVKNLTEGVYNPIAADNLKIAEERRNKIREIIGNDNFEKIISEVTKMSKDEIVDFVLGS
ncbi:MAG: tetratricopeptide repeat protein [Ignavibacteria bacterium]|nr:tetratricopeptide repeat protein [Ignavibacteria bacterium]